MPCLKIQTNTAVQPNQRADLLSQASRIVSDHLDKDEKYFMGLILPELDMVFAGSDSPLALLELRALGLPAEKTNDLSYDLCALVHTSLGIPEDRIYVEFGDVPRGMWGWNGGVF